MKTFISKVLRTRIARNTLALTLVQFSNYVLPLLTIPYLARILGPSEWGLLAFHFAFAQYISLIIEYGFNLAGTREVAKFRDDKDYIAELFAGIAGTKILLTALCLFVAVLLRQVLIPLQTSSLLFWSSIFWAIAQAFRPLWYYQGIEKITVVSILDLIAKSVVTLIIFLVITNPHHTWRYFVLHGLAATLVTVVLMFKAHRSIPMKRPNFKKVMNSLRLGLPLFLNQNAEMLYVAGNSLILGLFAPIEYVGYYSGAEKIVRASAGLFYPVIQAIYPRVSYLSKHAPEEISRWIRRCGLMTIIPSIGISVLLFLLAPYIVKILYGDLYSKSVIALQIMSPIIPLIVTSMTLGSLWMLPFGMDFRFNIIIASGGLVNLTCSMLLAPKLLHVGMSLSLVCTEVLVTISMVSLYWRNSSKINIINN